MKSFLRWWYSRKLRELNEEMAGLHASIKAHKIAGYLSASEHSTLARLEYRASGLALKLKELNGGAK